MMMTTKTRIKSCDTQDMHTLVQTSHNTQGHVKQLISLSLSHKPELGHVIMGREQVKQLFVVQFQEGDAHRELQLLHAELVKQVVNAAGDYAGQWVLWEAEGV